ncbi:MAG: hypothetical protein COV91_03170 [Candidatus Taylorbacteria bacterium CG11_big_fil_rev_8_21_14_0_20_46_11]|uniref:Uncharacterized protein n=1 Tax=Candidatus Taylorbacteria bacterium CG11_big_fil_rev_8_21_14_0_20_46_11 TaxID=1975025 RepID=A0A2H0KBL3_9BACT|nr:MAG: hypothetical protein COV91_03170 [Candidatus Taylorbacteria bacterium CG11_big_fil_rev_8_21_14_0_20_46_11]
MKTNAQGLAEARPNGFIRAGSTFSLPHLASRNKKIVSIFTERTPIGNLTRNQNIVINTA